MRNSFSKGIVPEAFFIREKCTKNLRYDSKLISCAFEIRWLGIFDLFHVCENEKKKKNENTVMIFFQIIIPIPFH